MDDRTADDPVGTLGEEALKLVAAASAWAGQQQAAGPAGPAGGQAPAPCPSCGTLTGAAACTWCPICQAAAFVRSASPEVGEALRRAAVSLSDLARTVLEALAEHQQHDRAAGADRSATGPDVEKIDLAGDQTGDQTGDGGDDAWD